LKREITVDGKTFQVDVSQCLVGEPFEVKVNGKQREITLEQEPEEARGFTIRVDRKSYQIELPAIKQDSPLSIKVNNIPFKIELKIANIGKIVTPSILNQIPMASVRSRTPLMEGAVAAPMTGKIVSIKVKKGEAVKAGKVLCVLEAMKMENEIVSPKAGVVDEITVQEGKAVNEGDVLMIVK
jgi:biotin carboxyl carrier protein